MVRRDERRESLRERPPRWPAFLALVASVLAALCAPAQAALPGLGLPPIGPHTALTDADFLGVSTWKASDRLVLTPYFYWYDVFTGDHLLNPDGSDALTDHPPTYTGFSLRSPAWHRTQLEDMEAAGIDVALPVYWGEPSQRIPGASAPEHPWSYAGLPPLVEARDRLVREGRNPPRLGLFYDTSTLQFNAAGRRIDLTTDAGRQWFYETVRDFYSLVPPRHWATIEGRPIVFLYASGFAAAHDQTCLDHLRASFARDFGGRTPHVVREISWSVRADDTYAWGGALGLRNPGVASLGPGYDHSAVPDRSPLVVSREDGAFFESQWLAFLRRPSPRVLIETWNEFHEGTDIAASREYGRKYIELNRRFADLFKAGYQPPPEPGSRAGTRKVEVQLGPTNRVEGLIQVESADGRTEPAVMAGSVCRVATTNAYGPRYVYFRIEDSFKTAGPVEVLAIVEFLDAHRGTLKVDFDGSDPGAPFDGAYSTSDPVAMTGSGQWRTATFRLRQAQFLQRQNALADFRLSVGNLPVAIRTVQIVREGLTAARLPAAPGSDRGCELGIYGAPGSTYDLETSADLRDWRPLARLRPATSVSRYLDQPEPAPAARWYRLRRAGP